MNWNKGFIISPSLSLSLIFTIDLSYAIWQETLGKVQSKSFQLPSKTHSQIHVLWHYTEAPKTNTTLHYNQMNVQWNKYYFWEISLKPKILNWDKFYSLYKITSDV